MSSLNIHLELLGVLGTYLFNQENSPGTKFNRETDAFDIMSDTTLMLIICQLASSTRPNMVLFQKICL